MKKIFLLPFMLLVISVNAQKFNGDYWCGSTQYNNYLHEIDPDLASLELSYNKQLYSALKQININNLNKTTGLDSNTIYEIPVVFHINHGYNVTNNGDWVSEASVLQTLEDINAYFNGSYADTSGIYKYWKPFVANNKIKFVLAKKDPNGQCTNGIHRIMNYKTFEDGDAGKVQQWPTDAYLNIWVSYKPNIGGVLAYAIKPASATPAMRWRDGVMCGSDIVANPANYRSTLAHEFGHILNLDHTWGGTNSPEVSCGDDDVDDTPPTAGQQGPPCPSLTLKETSCWIDTINHAYDRWLLDTAATSNVQNIMNYGFCSSEMFTWGQKDRMRAVLQNIAGSTSNGLRDSLIGPTAKLISGIKTNTVCTPKADFYTIATSSRFVVGDKNISLKNFSYNLGASGNSFTWDLPNASPNSATSNISNGIQVINYPNATGWQSVKLTANSSTGQGVTEKANFIYVQDPTATSGSLNDFENPARNAKWPIFNYFENMFKWEISNSGQRSGNTCIRYKGFDSRSYPSNQTGTVKGDYDDFFTEVINTSTYTTPSLNFFISAAARTSNYIEIKDDELSVQYSINGGLTWFNLGSLKGPALYPNAVSTSEYTAAGWGSYYPVSFPITGNAKSSAVTFRFRMKAGNKANNTYIDDIYVGDFTAGVHGLTEDNKLQIFPNPASRENGFTINHKDGFLNSKITVSDMLGRVIYQTQINDPKNSFVVSSQNFNQTGMFMVTVEKDGQSITKKLTLY